MNISIDRSNTGAECVTALPQGVGSLLRPG